MGGDNTRSIGRKTLILINFKKIFKKIRKTFDAERKIRIFTFFDGYEREPIRLNRI